MQLEWVAPPECPPQAAVVSRVRALAGDHALALERRVRARVVRVDARRWRLELTVGEEDAEPRIFESDECSKLANATALIVSLDLRSRERREDGATEPLTEPAAEPLTKPPTEPPMEPEPPAEGVPARRGTGPSRPSTPLSPSSAAPRVARSVPHVLLGTRLLGDAGSLSGPAAGVGFSGALVYDRWRAQVGATLFAPRFAAVDGQREVGVRTYLRTADVQGCWSMVASPLELDGCAGLQTGGLYAVGVGVRRPSTSAGTWFSALAGITGRHAIASRFRLIASVEVGVPILVPEAVIEGVGKVYSPAAVFGRVSVGFETVLF